MKYTYIYIHTSIHKYTVCIIYGFTCITYSILWYYSTYIYIYMHICITYTYIAWYKVDWPTYWIPSIWFCLSLRYPPQTSMVYHHLGLLKLRGTAISYLSHYFPQNGMQWYLINRGLINPLWTITIPTIPHMKPLGSWLTIISNMFQLLTPINPY